MWCCCCLSVPFSYTGYKLSILPSSLPTCDVRAMVGSLPHFLGYNLSRESESSVAYLIPLHGHNRSFSVKTPTQTKKKKPQLVRRPFFFNVNFVQVHPRQPSWLSPHYTQILIHVLRRSREIVKAMCPWPHCIRYLHLKSHSVSDSE